MLTEQEAHQQMQERISLGMRLAEDTDRKLYIPRDRDRERGFDVVTMGDMMESMEGAGFDDRRIASTAIMLENTRAFFESLDETTRLINIGDFEKYAFDGSALAA
jgi:hypothetical protein